MADRGRWIAAVTLVLCSVAGAKADTVPFDFHKVASRNVLVSLESNNGWGGVTHSWLSCDGRFGILGAYDDTTTIRGTVPADSALAFVNELLAMNFFELSPEFGSRRVQLAPALGDSLWLRTEKWFDAGSERIELHVGPRSHAVELGYPAHGAPQALKDWVGRFKAFIQAHRGW